MKKTITYMIAVVAALFVVVVCAVLPPYLAQKNDAVFLNVPQKDTKLSESYEYKATKYQKTKVLYEVCNNYFDSFRGYQIAEYERQWNESAVEGSAGGFPTATPEAADSELPASPIQIGNYTPELTTTEAPANSAVMTRVEAEMAIVREARLLQSTGALPQFDLSKLDSAEAVTSITFWTASDPAVANQEFYYWEGQITNPRTGDSYNLVIDDDLGKAYFLDIPYRMKIDAPDETGPAAADAFAKYHEVSVGDLLNVGYYDIYIDFLYATDNTDYQVLVEMDESNERFKMILKPSDII